MPTTPMVPPPATTAQKIQAEGYAKAEKRFARWLIETYADGKISIELVREYLNALVDLPLAEAERRFEYAAIVVASGRGALRAAGSRYGVRHDRWMQMYDHSERRIAKAIDELIQRPLSIERMEYYGHPRNCVCAGCAPRPVAAVAG